MNQIVDLPNVHSNLITYLIFPFLSVISFYILKIYNSSYRYFNINDIFRLVMGIGLNSLFIFIYSGDFERTFVLNQLLFFFLLASFLISYLILIKVSENINNIMIFSAGNNEKKKKRAFYNSSEFKTLGFIDDDKLKIGKNLDGVRVFEIGSKLNKFIFDNDISKVIISTKKISVNRKAYLFKYFQNLNIQILELPPLKSWINGIPNINN